MAESYRGDKDTTMLGDDDDLDGDWSKGEERTGIGGGSSNIDPVNPGP